MVRWVPECCVSDQTSRRRTQSSLCRVAVAMILLGPASRCCPREVLAFNCWPVLSVAHQESIRRLSFQTMNHVCLRRFGGHGSLPATCRFRRTTVSESTVHQEPSLSEQPLPPLLLAEGLLAVTKPLNWTSNDVVSYIRGVLERDARERGARPEKVGSRRNKGQIVRVGHGGTLDPLATGVLVIGVGKGTKQLQR
jgi:TruB family pseudouridylate synthase (N terminal domain)